MRQASHRAKKNKILYFNPCTWSFEFCTKKNIYSFLVGYLMYLSLSGRLSPWLAITRRMMKTRFKRPMGKNHFIIAVWWISIAFHSLYHFISFKICTTIAWTLLSGKFIKAIYYLFTVFDLLFSRFVRQSNFENWNKYMRSKIMHQT